MVRPSILCPVDFSHSSRGALRYAAAIAEHFYAGLTVATVDDPLLTGAAGVVYDEGMPGDTSRKELQQFLAEALGARRPTFAKLQLEVATGKPAIEIKRIAGSCGADLIVMSSHGRSGVPKLFFGSTTERVLRETQIPVLVTPAEDPGPADLEDLLRRLKGILAPVDLSDASRRQVQIASGLAEALSTSLVLLHVVEQPMPRPGREWLLRRMFRERWRQVDEELVALTAMVPADRRPEVVIAEGDPAHEIATLAIDRHIGVIVMGLHSTSALGPRMGSITYRVLCQTDTLVLALPPVLPAQTEASRHVVAKVTAAR